MCIAAENAGDSDSDTYSDDILEYYYQPLSATADEEEGNGDGEEDLYEVSDENHGFGQRSMLANGYHHYRVENGTRSLNLSEDGDGESKDDEEEERRRAESDSAMRRAFEEDESRRNAPLTAENAIRVMEAMRGVSFEGSAPDWVLRVPEDQWVDQLRKLPRSPHSAA